MKCPFCAEEIQEAAIVCRFCNAFKQGTTWTRGQDAARPPKSPKGHLTMRVAAVFFILSGIFELFSLTSPVALFGDVRSGAVAVLQHLVDAALCVVLGIGIWGRRAWGYRAVLIGTAFYSLEKLIYIFDTSARKAELAGAFKGFEQYAHFVDQSALLGYATITSVAMMLSWWVFAYYVYARRDYFSVNQ